MGKRGLLPQSDKVKALKARMPCEMPKNITPVLIPLTIPEPPEHFRGEILQTWHNTVNLLKDRMMLEAIDWPAVAAFCDACHKWKMAEFEIERIRETQGVMACLTDTGSTGNTMIHALIKLSRDAKADMVYYAAQLGMTPAARLRMQGSIIGTAEKKANVFKTLREMGRQVE
jgi:P27 family predicted phage terminase small subunit